MRQTLFLAAALTAVALAGCSNSDRKVAGLCKAFPTQAVAATDGGAVLEDCIHRWAYSLAGSSDDAGTVADAVLAACGGPLSRWNQQTLTAAAGAPPAEGQSLLTGEATNPIAQHASFAGDRALFYVVQARAGGCKPPPKREGGPVMTAPDA